MAGIQLSGLVSGSFDWQSVVNQLIQVDSTPITNLQTTQATNNNELASLAQLKSEMTDLQTSATALQADGLFNGRTVSSTTAGSTWTPIADNGAAIGSYTLAVTELATAASRVGASGISSGLSATDDVTGLTLANLPIATPVTAGTFTVDGQQVTVGLTDSLSQAFQKISDATGGNVTASYDSTTDKVTLASADHSEIVLGAGNDTSNFLSSLRLANNGADSTTSSAKLGTASLSAPLASGHLLGALTGVDGSGNGSFSVNGVSIAYNINTDSLSTVLGRINASTAGVTASYDSGSDRVVLTNNATGDTGIGASESSPGLLAALGLGSASTLQHGLNAQLSVNGGSPITSASNTLDATTLGVAGLSVTVNSKDMQTITVAPNTGAMTDAIQDFITKYNTLQSDITAQTAVTTGSDGTVQTSTLSGKPEVEAWGSKLRSMAFDEVAGLTGTVQRLDDLGIDFNSTEATLSIKDTTKLNDALTNHSADVGAYFGNAAGGFAQQFNTWVTNMEAPSGDMTTQVNTINQQNTDITAQIATLNTRLDDERTQLTNAFIAMQTAQSNAQSQQQILNGLSGGSTATTSSSAGTTNVTAS